MPKSNIFVTGSIHQDHEPSRTITIHHDHGKGNVPLCVFQRYVPRIGPIEQYVVFRYLKAVMLVDEKKKPH